MKRKQEKIIAKFIKKIAKCNPDVPFLYNNDGIVVADSTWIKVNDGSEMNLTHLDLPEEYYALDILDSNKKEALVLDAITEDPITTLLVDNCLDLENADKYENFIQYELKESTIGNFFKKVYNKVKNAIKYKFSQRADVLEELKSLEPAKKPVKKPVKTEPIKEEPKKQEPKKEPVVKQEPKKVTPKKDIVLDKVYELYNKRAYMKLGEFEKMFVDDAKAECLNPFDPEFNQMLNERTVNKEAIYNYYFETEGNNIKKSFEKIYSDLGEYERMFVEDALAENLNVEDNEFRQMLNERTVNKEQVISFMKGYKENLIKQKEIISKYSKFCNIDEKDYSTFTINELRKSASENRNMLTGAELDKFKESKLKKDELVEIMNRIDAKKNEQEVSRKLGL